MGVGLQNLKRAVFLDRDGVLNAAVVKDGKPYPPENAQTTVILPDVLEALRRLKAAGYGLAVTTNQPDVARGTRTRPNVEEINAFLASKLPIDHFEVCYHDESANCDCRKPKPGLIHRAAAALGARAAGGFMVGDRWRDIDAGIAAHCRTVWIDRGYSERPATGFDFRALSLLEAAEWILTQP